MLLPTLAPVTGPVSPVAQQWGGFPWGSIHGHSDCPWGHGGRFAGGTASTGLSFRVWIIWGAGGRLGGHLGNGICGQVFHWERGCSQGGKSQSLRCGPGWTWRE